MCTSKVCYEISIFPFVLLREYKKKIVEGGGERAWLWVRLCKTVAISVICYSNKFFFSDLLL